MQSPDRKARRRTADGERRRLVVDLGSDDVHLGSATHQARGLACGDPATADDQARPPGERETDRVDGGERLEGRLLASSPTEASRFPTISIN